MAFIMIFLVAICVPSVAQKLSLTSTYELTGISLPENTKRDKRYLIEIAGKEQLKDEADRCHSVLTAIEILRISKPFTEESFKNCLSMAGWLIYPSATNKIYWATRQSKTILIYLNTNKESTDIYFCEAKSSNNNPLVVRNIPVSRNGYVNQNVSGGTLVNGAWITCGNLLFTVPAGWKLEADGENCALMLPPRYNDPKRWVNMAIFIGSASSGNIEVDFKNAWQKFLGKYTKYQEPYLLREKSTKGYDIVRGGTNISKGNEMPIYAHLWVAKVKDRLENIVVFANNSSDFDIAENQDIKPFLAKLQFKNLPLESPATYAVKGNGMLGVYMGLQSGLSLNDGIRKNISFLIIYEDGKLKVANKLPENGFYDFDREADIGVNAAYWGDYDLSRSLVFFNGVEPKRTLGFSYQPPNLIYNKYAYIKLPSVDGLRLSGTYTADQSQTAAGTFGHEPTISFNKDGSFQDNNALYYVRSYDVMFKTPGRGSYYISNFTINLVYDDGRGRVSFSFISMDLKNNNSIQVGEIILLKK
jgi:hypothetical protein